MVYDGAFLSSLRVNSKAVTQKAHYIPFDSQYPNFSFSTSELQYFVSWSHGGASEHLNFLLKLQCCQKKNIVSKTIIFSMLSWCFCQFLIRFLLVSYPRNSSNLFFFMFFWTHGIWQLSLLWQDFFSYPWSRTWLISWLSLLIFISCQAL